MSSIATLSHCEDTRDRRVFICFYIDTTWVTDTFLAMFPAQTLLHTVLASRSCSSPKSEVVSLANARINGKTPLANVRNLLPPCSPHEAALGVGLLQWALSSPRRLGDGCHVQDGITKVLICVSWQYDSVSSQDWDALHQQLSWLYIYMCIMLAI